MPPKPLGSDYINNCLVSAGYTWCEILNKCVRLWEESCSYPSNCLTWNDGCNTCSLVEGEDSTVLGIGVCTEMYCFTRNTPYCMVYAPDGVVGIEPWLMNPQPIIDPMPPVINPFLGDGH